MRPKAILAVATLLLAGGWLAGVAAQTPPAAQQTQANRARPATQGAVDDIRTELGTINRELANLTRLMTVTAQRLQDVQDGVGELRARAAEARDRIAEASVGISDTRERMTEIVSRIVELRGVAGTAMVSVGLGASTGPMSQAVREAAAQTCEAMAGGGMSSEVVYAQSSGNIGSSQVVCRLRPR